MRKTMLTLLIVVASFATTFAADQNTRWIPVGPDGGDVRALAYDPRNPDRVYAGSTTGEMFVSEDFGKHWRRFAHIGGPGTHDYVLDNIVVNPQTGSVYVAAWTLLHDGGGVYRSDDEGRTWQTLTPMQGKSVRSFAMAPSNSKMLVAGALDGVYRSMDGGSSWERISPPNYKEIRAVESVAIDPVDTNVIYAGTWHLPWKTTDGGKTWKNIHNGVLDDSDVFSIIVDPKTPSVVYASACSGIYRSDNGGELFHKAQGIPFTARRTRVLQQDPVNRQVVYAGTTEGLWKTSNGGSAWKRMTGPGTIINDVLVDPRDPSHVLLATDRSGILASHDSGASFVPSNAGYSQRIISALVVSQVNRNTIYTGLIKDKEEGGVFASHDFGEHWQQISRGLGDKDVFALGELPNGELVAGTEKGVYVRSSNGEWRPSNEVIEEGNKIVPTKRLKNGKRVSTKSVKTMQHETLNARVNGLVHEGDEWLAATTSGLYVSRDNCKSWRHVPVEGLRDLVSVTRSKDDIVVAGMSSIRVSSDAGKTWHDPKLQNVTSIVSLASTPDGQLWAAGREAAFRSTDHGATWHYMWKLPTKHIAYLAWVPGLDRIVAAGSEEPGFLETKDGMTWTPVSTGWLVRGVAATGERVVAASAFDGLIVNTTAGGVQTASTGR